MGTLLLSPRMFFDDDDDIVGLAAGRGRRRGLDPPAALVFSPGSQFSLSESPDGDAISPLSFSFVESCSCAALLRYCKRARLDCALPSFGFLMPCLLVVFLDESCCWGFRLLVFALRAAELLVERMRLMAATAEPLDSRSAWAVSSSRTSPSARICQVRASRERPRPREGTNGGIEELLVWVGYGMAL